MEKIRYTRFEIPCCRDPNLGYNGGISSQNIDGLLTPEDIERHKGFLESWKIGCENDHQGQPCPPDCKIKRFLETPSEVILRVIEGEPL